MDKQEKFNSEFQDTINGIADNLVKLYENDFFDEEGYFYFDDIFNLDYVIRVNYGMIGVRIMITCGGPNIWIDTLQEEVIGYWGSTVCRASLPRYVCDDIEDIFREYAEHDIENTDLS